MGSAAATEEGWRRELQRLRIKRTAFTLATVAAFLVGLSCAESGAGVSVSEPQPQPTMFEIAMERTRQAVKEGRVPDPATRWTDRSTPAGASASRSNSSNLSENSDQARRQLGANDRPTGVKLPLAPGPTLSVLNASYFRYQSVVVLANASVDWRNTMYITPIQTQFDCYSCWAMAAADTVAMASAIATNTAAVAAGVQQICDCSGMACCQGGWPESAYAWMMGQGNITTSANYNYFAQDGRTCTLGSNYPIAGKITGWERVPAYSQSSLLKAVSMQPVLAYLSASATDFQQYTSTAPGTPGFNIYNGVCNNEVNHAVVVVGFNQLGGYWIVKNTWPAFGWGDNGYMYLAMQSGSGKCGMLTVNPLYPTYFPNAPQQATVFPGSTAPSLNRRGPWWVWWQPPVTNPCNGVINPCGAGTCYWTTGSPVARCNCTAPYKELVGVPTSICVDPYPCANATVDPCGAGNCSDVGDGSYTCGCPQGYAIGARVNGLPTCVTRSNLTTYVTLNGDTCAKIGTAFTVTYAQLMSQNPFLDCSGALLPGLVITLPSGSSPIACTQQYAVQPGDSCSSILRAYSLSSSMLLALNPTLNCSRLYLSQLICVSNSTGSSSSQVQCGQTYTTVNRVTCKSVMDLYNLNVTTFQLLNPGIKCNNVNKKISAGSQLCVAFKADDTNTNVTVPVNCTQYYSVQQGDSCPQIWNAANLSQFQLLYINPDLQCQDPYLFVGQQICINSPLLASIPDPSYLLYTIQPNDSLATIQAQYSSRCKASSITFDLIAAANNILDWTNYTVPSNGTLIIPCVPKIGASCGCVPSLTVCGANMVNYPSYCDALCNFDTPAVTGACTTCQSACTGRYGLTPSPASACTAGYICPYPTWPPLASDASKLYTTSPLCNYRAQTCSRACTMFQTTTGGSSTSCYNSCYSCNRVPCAGSSEAVSVASSYCPSCSSVGCSANGRSTTTCLTVCSYWNTFWNPLNP